MQDAAKQPDFGEQLFGAALAGDRERLGALCATLPAAARQQVLVALSQQLARPDLWAGAVTAFDAMGELTGEQQMRRCLAANMACLQKHRPELHRMLVTSEGSTRYTVGRSAEGMPTVLYRSDNQVLTSLSPEGGPIRGLEHIRRVIERGYQRGDILALCNIGDGYLLDWVAKNPPALFQERQQTIYVVEPDVRALLPCLMIHDYAGEHGPIRSERFWWFVGPGWDDAYIETLRQRPGLGIPATQISIGLTGNATDLRLRELTQQIDAQTSRQRVALESEYAAISTSELADRLEGRGSRPARALLITTRFTHTLKYSNADLARTLEGFGWQTRTIAEEKDYELVTDRYLQSQVADFRPDVIIQINHLRREYVDAVPAGIPWVCWIQDHQVQLTSAEAGRSVGPRDFVITGAGFRYSRRWEYPPQQVVDMAKLTLGEAHGSGVGRRDDLIYVSHWSKQPQEILDGLSRNLRAFSSDTNFGSAIEHCARRLINWYQQGRNIKTDYGIRRLIRRSLDEVGLCSRGGEAEDTATSILFEQLNNALYRQQTLSWAAQTAKELGLSFGLYGTGWDKHPEFAPYARGVVKYGKDLAEVTRGARINLQIEPYASITHQRMLDGLAAGGFFLIREHPFNKGPQRLAAFLETRVPRSLTTVQEVREALSPQDRTAFEQQLNQMVSLSELGDPIGILRCWQRTGWLGNGADILPDVDEVSFDSLSEFRAKVEKFLGNEALRHEIRGKQFAFVSGHLTYSVAFRRVFSDIAQRLRRQEAQGIELATASSHLQWQEQLETLEASEDWSGACELLSSIAHKRPEDQRRQMQAKNLAALKQHRPELYQRVIKADAQHYRVIPTRTPQPSLAEVKPDGTLSPLLTTNDPKGLVDRTVAQLREPISQQMPLCVAGIADGYLLHAIVEAGQPDSLGKQQALLVIEPDAELLRACLSIHDFAADGGEIRARRVQWIVGADWKEQLHHVYDTQLYSPVPRMTIQQGPHGPAIAEAVNSLMQDWKARDQALAQQVAALYAARSQEQHAAAMAGRLARPGRVMLMTTRYSTVLKYATRDAAEAFAQLGWETHIVIEPEDHLELTKIAVRKILADFQPDMVFQIDHLRHEHADLIPENVPFVCWIQDHLPNLTSCEAGRQVGELDFVMTGAVYRYTNQYGYPSQQCIAATKPARNQTLPEAWQSDGEEMIYVSNQSMTPQQAVAQTLAACQFDESGKRMIEGCCGEMIRTYRAGRSLPTTHDIRLIVESTERRIGAQCATPDVRRQVIHLLFDILNNVLYRQQALTWAARLAKEMGLRLGIYGRGWNGHPEFAPFARGVVEHGEPLSELMRRSCINLQLEPYACYSHQRMLDGLMAGGFFLVRNHPFNTFPSTLGDFLNAHAPEAQTLEEVQQTLSRTRANELGRLLDQCPALSELGDVVEVVRSWQAAQILPAGAHPMPRLEEITFHDYDSFAIQALRYLADAPARRQIALQQRQAIADRLTYVPLIRRVIGAIGERLASRLNRDLSSAPAGGVPVLAA